MRKDIILIVLVLIAVVSISGCINSPIDNINNRMKDLNTDITEGDNEIAVIMQVETITFKLQRKNSMMQKQNFQKLKTIKMT